MKGKPGTENRAAEKPSLPLERPPELLGEDAAESAGDEGAGDAGEISADGCQLFSQVRGQFGGPRGHTSWTRRLPLRRGNLQLGHKDSRQIPVRTSRRYVRILIAILEDFINYAKFALRTQCHSSPRSTIPISTTVAESAWIF